MIGMKKTKQQRDRNRFNAGLTQLAHGCYRFDDGTAQFTISADGEMELDERCVLAMPHVIDMGRFHAISTLLRGITDPTRVHAINTPLLATSSEA